MPHFIEKNRLISQPFRQGYVICNVNKFTNVSID